MPGINGLRKYRPTKLSCRLDLLIIIFISVRFLRKQVLPIQVREPVSRGMQDFQTTMPKLNSGRIQMIHMYANIKITASAQFGLSIK